MTGYLDGLDGVPTEYSRNVLERLAADSKILLASQLPEHGLSCREEADQLHGVMQLMELALAARVDRVRLTRAYQDGDRTFGSLHSWLTSGARMTGAEATRHKKAGQQMLAEGVSALWADAANGKAPVTAARLASDAIVKIDRKLREQAKAAREFAKGRILAGLEPVQDPSDPNAYLCTETEEDADRRISNEVGVYTAIMVQLNQRTDSLRHVRRAIAVLNAKFDPDGTLDAWESTQDKRHVALWEQEDGCFAGKFVLPPEAGAKLKALFDKYGRKSGPDDLRSKEQRQGDVLIALLNQQVATELLVIVDAATLLDDPEAPCDCPDHQPGNSQHGSTKPSPEPTPEPEPDLTLFDEPVDDAGDEPQPGNDNADRPGSADEPANDEPDPANEFGHGTADANLDDDSDAGVDDSDVDEGGDGSEGDGGNTDARPDSDGKYGFNMNGRWRGRTQDADLGPNGAPPNGGPDPRIHDLGCIDSMGAKVRDVLDRFRDFDPDRDDPSDLDRPGDHDPPPGPQRGPDRPTGQRDPRDPGRPHGPWDHPGGQVLPVPAGQRCDCCGRAPLNLDVRNGPAMIVSTGALMPAPIARRRAYTSTLYRVVLQGGSVPVNASTATRHIPDHIDRAMKALYSHCVYDDCVMPIEWTQRDHMLEFEHHGRTHPAEIAPGCAFHNGDRGAQPDKYIREKMPDGRWHLRTDPNWRMRRKPRKKNH